MLNTKSILSDENRGRIYIVLITVMFAMLMLIETSKGWGVWHDRLYLAGLIAELCLIFLAVFGRRKGCIEDVCLILFFSWLCISRLFNGDVRLEGSIFHLRLVALCLALFYCGYSMPLKYRVLTLRVLSVLLCAVFFVIGLAGLYAALGHTSVRLPLDVYVGLDMKTSNYYLNVLSENRNTASFWFVLCFCLGIYQMTVCKRKLLYIPIALSMAVDYLFVALTLSRGSTIALSGVVAMLVVLLLKEHMSAGTKAFKAAVMALAVALALILTYKSYGIIGQLIDDAYLASGAAAAQAAEADESDAAEAKVDASDESEAADEADEAGTKEVTGFQEYRGKSDMTRLSGRIPLWKSAIAALRVEPDRLFKGRLIDEYMDLPNMLNPEKAIKLVNYGTAHNYLLDVLMFSGLPGLALVGLFTLFLFIRMLRVFFRHTGSISLKVLTLPLTATLAKNMMEANILRVDDISNYLFFLIAGIFIAGSYDLLPKKDKKSK